MVRRWVVGSFPGARDYSRRKKNSITDKSPAITIGMHQHFGMDQHFQGVALKLASLLVNNVELAVGDAFPIGWSLLTGDREYAIITGELLQEAQCLLAALECE